MIWSAKWIQPANSDAKAVPLFQKRFETEGEVKRATLQITSVGVYEAFLNGKRVGDFILPPGWTSYEKRLQYQEYDVTSQVERDNTLSVLVAGGWVTMRSGLVGSIADGWAPLLLAALKLELADGSRQMVFSDESWSSCSSPILMSSFYHGETCDARIQPKDFVPVALAQHPYKVLIPQEGEKVIEHETLAPMALIKTPKGETVIDFGQNMTGYPTFRLSARAGDRVELSFAEVLDRDGNFYTDNYRSAQIKITYICREGEQSYKPHLSFQGFRYLRVDAYPLPLNSLEDVAGFGTIVVYSDIRRTGHFECSDPLVNRLYQNIIWGQKGNFLDIPTDCPQRDERLGWTGDAEVFIKAASYNFDVNRFFRKWLADLAADQFADGSVPLTVPNSFEESHVSRAAWSDAATVCPWQMYLTYGDISLLAEQYGSMKRWVDWMHRAGPEEYLWLGSEQYGDWLALDAEEGSYVGATDKDLVASAYYAYSTQLLIKAGKVLGLPMEKYALLYDRIVDAFQQRFMPGGVLISDTQTAHVLAIHFQLTPDREKTAGRLVELLRENGYRLKTGFVGTPYLLHALSSTGHADVAYSLLLQQEYPSWLYSVNKGATTIWEHWDGIKPDGSMWSTNMNSFNHYAYGAVADWMYGAMAGIQTDESRPGFSHVIFAPVPDTRMDWVKASIDTRHGLVESSWKRVGGKVEYTFTVPNGATGEARFDGKVIPLDAGTHRFCADAI